MNRDNSSQKWRLEGDYFEGCNCKTVCPCTFMFSPNEGECKAAIAWHIEKGYFDNNNTLNLDDLNAAAIFMLLAICLHGRPKIKMALYLDERASHDQKDALTKIFSGKVSGGFFGIAANLIEEVLGVKSVPIEFSIEAKRRRIKTTTATTTLELK